MRSVVQKRQALAVLRQKGSPLVGCKDEKVLVLLVRVLSIKLLAHGASIFIQLLHEALAEDVVTLFLWAQVSKGAQVVQRTWQSSAEAFIVAIS